MARETQSPHSWLDRLAADLPQINFYRFCQLVEKLNPDKPPLGSTHHLNDDAVRLCPHPGMGFPASELKAVEYDEEDDQATPVVRTTFLGLYGVTSPLPTPYIDDIAQRKEGHEALQRFLDIFNHRILTQFYRIWRKYSYPATFEAGGTDSVSCALLGLVGLGIPGTAKQIATPVSRFLALLGVLSQPAKTEEGVQALVHLLAPKTSVRVQPYCLRPIAISQPIGFSNDEGFLLDGGTPLGDEVMDASSQLLIDLSTEDEQEMRAWMPNGTLYQEFLIMLRVYLGWRFNAKIRLTLSTALLAMAPLGEAPCWLGINGVLGVTAEDIGQVAPTFTTELGCYKGLPAATTLGGERSVRYKFE